MKTLPDNPHPEHLRRQAKDLLAGLRDSDPTVTLAGAQATLAGQYGFRTWTDLLAEVDRRRGCAAVADPALARAIAAHYDLGQVTGEMRSLARPDESGRRWSLRTDRGRWSVRTMDTWWPIVDVETEVAFRLAAAAAGVRLPTPVRGRAGDIVVEIGGHRWRVDEWLHSGPPLAAPAGSAVTREVGGILATLHGLNWPVERISPWHRLRLSEASWPDLAASARAAGASWAPELERAVDTLVRLDAVAADEKAGDEKAGDEVAKPVLSHNTLGPGQARLGADGRVIVVGWEHAGGQPPAWELGNALMDWTVNPGGGVNTAGARALVDGYHTAAGALPPIGPGMFRGAITGQANYLTGQIRYALAARDDEDRRYADRSVRHLLAHLPTPDALALLLDVALGAARR
ncbi:aminoglycoside phosphotransferase family protein [Solwaraspora sp. WMMD1047]|uniref:phosphotransferase n=1 Tax=Solwaraspora sp. WMMD1047 TaxID=3016102 RepID=UPI002417C82A|nr:aminoglycoside phosphotransferase family protein [Solwaraspora sp. WMMD1047]MDG4831213.1 aminoglycoside phosphotransferase family protein [Solwaraspora sp. WMMD1047]